MKTPCYSGYESPIFDTVMDAELNKFSLNGLASLVSPGALVLVFLIYGFTLFTPIPANYFKEYELFSVFLFITASYIMGVFIHSIGSGIERRFYKRQKHNPRMTALKGNHHWLETLDKLYAEKVGLHLYEISKADQLPKAGPVNGKQVDKFNLSQFEYFAAFYLQKSKLYEEPALFREKYLFFRNLSVAFFLNGFLTILYVILGKPISVLGTTHEARLHYEYLSYIIIALFFAAGILLFFTCKRQRVTYLRHLYRCVRYNYLLETS